MLDGERTEQANLDQADLLAVGVEVVDDLLGDVAEGAHATTTRSASGAP